MEESSFLRQGVFGVGGGILAWEEQLWKRSQFWFLACSLWPTMRSMDKRSKHWFQLASNHYSHSCDLFFYLAIKLMKIMGDNFISLFVGYFYQWTNLVCYFHAWFLCSTCSFHRYFLVFYYAMDIASKYPLNHPMTGYLYGFFYWTIEFVLFFGGLGIFLFSFIVYMWVELLPFHFSSFP